MQLKNKKNARVRILIILNNNLNNFKFLSTYNARDIRDITYIKAIAKVKGREAPGTHPCNMIANTKVIDLLTVNRGLEDNYRTDEL